MAERISYIAGGAFVVFAGLLWAAISEMASVPETPATLIGMVVGGVAFLVGFDFVERRQTR